MMVRTIIAVPGRQV